MNINDIKRIDYGVLSTEMLKNIAVCKIDSIKLSGPGSVYDKAMGCTVDDNDPCITCGLKHDECVGHFGYIELAVPMIHPFFEREILAFLNIFCRQCKRLIVSEDHLKLISFNSGGSKRIDTLYKSLKLREACAYCKSIKPRFSLKDSVFTVEYEKKGGKKGEKLSEKLTPIQIKTFFESILDEDLNVLGLNPKHQHPSSFVITHLPVIPTCARPAVINDGNVCDDDLTGQYIQILKLNDQIRKFDELPKLTEEASMKRANCINKLYFRISTTLDNSKCTARNPSDSRPIKSLHQRITGKEGRIRQNLSGKRVNHSARTVIGPDPTLDIDQLGVPRSIAKTLSKPVIVAPFNMAILQKIVDSGKANFVKRVINGRLVKKNLFFAQNRNGTELLYGDILVRGVKSLEIGKNGNVILPIPRPAIEVIEIDEETDYYTLVGDKIVTSKKIVLVTSAKMKTLKAGTIVVRGFDGEFDTVPNASPPIQVIHITEQKITLEKGDFLIRDGKELKITESSKRPFTLEIGDIVERQLEDGDTVLFNRQPTLHKGSMLAYRIKIHDHKNLTFSPFGCTPFNADFDGDEMNIHVPRSNISEYELRELSSVKSNLISSQNSLPMIVVVQDALLASYLMTSKDEFLLTKEQFEDVLSGCFTLTGTSVIEEERVAEITAVNGTVRNGKGLFSLIFPSTFDFTDEDKANERKLVIKNGIFLEGMLYKRYLGANSSSLLLAIHTQYGKEEAFNFINNLQRIANRWLTIHGFSIGLEDCLINSNESRNEISKTIANCFVRASNEEISISNPGIREARVCSALNQGKDIGLGIAKNAMSKTNNFISSITSGAKGDFFNIAQITGILGQQNLEYGRPLFQLNNNKRALPHYPFDASQERQFEGRGFVTTSFAKGLTPEDFFSHSKSGRESVVNIANKTANTGYAQRRIVKLFEDDIVQYDGTVRDNGKIVQFVYNNDGLDPCHTVKVNGEYQFCNAEAIVNLLNKQLVKPVKSSKPKPIAEFDDFEEEMCNESHEEDVNFVDNEEDEEEDVDEEDEDEPIEEEEELVEEEGLEDVDEVFEEEEPESEGDFDGYDE